LGLGEMMNEAIKKIFRNRKAMIPSPPPSPPSSPSEIKGTKEKYRCNRCGMAGGFCDIFPAPEGSGFEKLCRQCCREVIKLARAEKLRC
jgi:ribosomal protein S14